ncbi:MAG: hypothetical protein MJ246_06995 [Clostridia bacterium]|nr:hypothetical protein [Clostridia bacterium]
MKTQFHASDGQSLYEFAGEVNRPNPAYVSSYVAQGIHFSFSGRQLGVNLRLHPSNTYVTVATFYPNTVANFTAPAAPTTPTKAGYSYT